MKVRVGVAGREHPAVLEVPAGATVAELRARIFAAEDALCPAKHRLRLIVAGKLVGDGLLSDAGVADGGFVHCAVSELPKGAEAAEALDGAERGLLGRERGERTQTVAVLRAAGFSDEQIVALRFPFLVRAAEGAPGEHVLHVDLDELEANERGEVAGLEADAANPAAAPDIEEGTFNDWWWGFVLGALLGLIMLILSMDRSIALSRRWRSGIGVGVGVNLVFGVFMLMSEKTGRA